MNHRRRSSCVIGLLFWCMFIANTGMAQRNPAYSKANDINTEIFASASRPDKDPPKKGRPKNDSSAIDDRKNAEEDDDNIYATLTPWGRSDGVHRGIDAGYFMSNDFSLGFRGEISREENFNYESWSIGVVARKFFRRTFYLSGSLKSRLATRSSSTSFFSGDERIERLYQWQYSDQGAEVAIGNQWRFKNFIFGCDWLGYYAPLLKSSKLTVTPQDSDPNSSEEPTDQFVLSGNSYLRIASFYVGFTF
jgi:hypothetical protein